MSKRTIKVRIHPNTKTKFVEDYSWEVRNTPAAIQVTDEKSNRAFCIEFGNIPEISVYEVLENGDFGDKLYSLQCNKKNFAKFY